MAQSPPPTPKEDHIPGPLKKADSFLITELTFLTLNTQKTDTTSPLLTDVVTMIGLHTPNFLILTDTPMLPQHRALKQALSNRGYKIHFHQVNAPPP